MYHWALRTDSSRIIFVATVSRRLRLKCDSARAETRFRLSAKRTSPFKSAGASVQSTTGSRGVRISGSNAGYTKFRGSVKGTDYPLHSPGSPSLPLPCITVCRHVSTGLHHGVHAFINSLSDLSLCLAKWIANVFLYAWFHVITGPSVVQLWYSWRFILHDYDGRRYNTFASTVSMTINP